MQLTINIHDTLPNEKAVLLIAELEQLFVKKGISCEIEKTTVYDDSWDNLDIDEIAVDTGIKDFAENHDHYLYGTTKHP